MTHYPLHLDVAGRRVLVVGAGSVAVRRVQSLLDAGALVDVVALNVSEDLPDVPVQRRAFAAGDVAGAWLVLACTGVVDDDVAAACEAQRIWCVRADDASKSAAWLPAVARVDDVVLSVSSGDPRRTTALRDAIALAVETGDLPLRRGRPGAGSVALVGGGPGDPGLLTVRGRRLLAGADVVVRDRLAPDVLLPADVEVVDVGKTPGGPSYDQRAIEQLLVDRARAGQRVVRLKGGDVHVFGRGMEEVAACVEAGVPVEVVPGVSSAFAVPAWAGIPVTARGVTQSVSVVSAHVAPDDPGSTVDWDALARLGGTVVLLMAVGRLESVCAALVAGGRDPKTQVAVIQDGTLPTQRVIVTTLDDAAHDAVDIAAPAIVVVGDVVGLR
ncbi:MAG: uroporphyrin-III C-methyltransferase / precorrin-2 dehydrogenase / sirohydrochlorin ferrochelatase [Actinomycetota bacterium]|nr:uroporphyrin-III C-methyltransferase / precorrin-2 dehydrogenase / sirohydrochlorin ferrochelatase [Actinomycetota bacterium]